MKSTGLDTTAPATFKSLTSERASPDGFDPSRIDPKTFKYYDFDGANLRNDDPKINKQIQLAHSTSSEIFYDRIANRTPRPIRTVSSANNFDKTITHIDHPSSNVGNKKLPHPASFNVYGLDCYGSFGGSGVARTNPLIHQISSEEGANCEVGTDTDDTLNKKHKRFLHESDESIYTTRDTINTDRAGGTLRKFSGEDFWFRRSPSVEDRDSRTLDIRDERYGYHIENDNSGREIDASSS